MSTITLTFGNRSENSVNGEKVGNDVDDGYNLQDLIVISNMFPNKCELIPLHKMGENLNPPILFEDAYILIIRNPTHFSDDIFINLLSNEDGDSGVNWDKHEYSSKHKDSACQGIVNLRARYKLMFLNLDPNYVRRPSYNEGKGTIYSLNRFDSLRSLYRLISSFPKSENMGAEGNYYYDIKKCSIKWHGDAERKRVIGYRMGMSMELFYRWYGESKPVSEIFSVMLNHGDMYIMSEKAVGTDWRNRRQGNYQLRHATGSRKTLGLV